MMQFCDLLQKASKESILTILNVIIITLLYSNCGINYIVVVVRHVYFATFSDKVSFRQVSDFIRLSWRFWIWQLCEHTLAKIWFCQDSCFVKICYFSSGSLINNLNYNFHLLMFDSAEVQGRYELYLATHWVLWSQLFHFHFHQDLLSFNPFLSNITE